MGGPLLSFPIFKCYFTFISFLFNWCECNWCLNITMNHYTLLLNILALSVISFPKLRSTHHSHYAILGLLSLHAIFSCCVQLQEKLELSWRTLNKRWYYRGVQMFTKVYRGGEPCTETGFYTEIQGKVVQDNRMNQRKKKKGLTRNSWKIFLFIVILNNIAH